MTLKAVMQLDSVITELLGIRDVSIFLWFGGIAWKVHIKCETFQNNSQL